MSSLIFDIGEQSALVATDTLAVTESGNPLRFTSKCFAVHRHLMLVANTRIDGPAYDISTLLRNEASVTGIEEIKDFISEFMRSWWMGYKQKFTIPARLTCTIYIFGFSEISGHLVCCVYRSENNFELETINGLGTGYKPQLNNPERFTFPDEIPAMMIEQRNHESTKPQDERIYIGGEIELFVLGREGISRQIVYRFDDYEEHAAVIAAG